MGRTGDASGRESPFLDAERRSAAGSFAVLGITLSLVMGALLWLVFTFPFGAAADFAVETSAAVAVAEACGHALTTTTTVPGARPPAAPTTTTLPPICAPIAGSTTDPTTTPAPHPVP
jgi:hypothetical protein